MKPIDERLILNLVACSCLIVTFVVLKYGFAESYKCLREHVKRHFSD